MDVVEGAAAASSRQTARLNTDRQCWPPAATQAVLTVGGQEFFMSAAPQAGNMEVLQLPSASTSYESTCVAGVRQRLSLLQVRAG